MKLRMIVACQQHRHGGPGIFHCVIEGSAKSYANGDFYDAAKRLASANDWESLMVAIDENDVPSLFADFPNVVPIGKVTSEDRTLTAAIDPAYAAQHAARLRKIHSQRATAALSKRK